MPDAPLVSVVMPCLDEGYDLVMGARFPSRSAPTGGPAGRTSGRGTKGGETSGSCSSTRPAGSISIPVSLSSDSEASFFDRTVTLETGLAAGAGGALLGLALVGHAVLSWRTAGWGALTYTVTMRWMIPGTLLLVLGAEIVFASFFLSVLGPKRR